MHPEVEWHSVLASVEGVTYHGRAGIREGLANIDRAYEGFQLHGEDLSEHGDSVLVIGRFTGAGSVKGDAALAPAAGCERHPYTRARG